MNSIPSPFAWAAPPLAFDALPVQVGAGVPMELTLTVSPAHPSNQLVLERRSDGVELPALRAWPDGVDPGSGAQRFRVRLPPLAPDEAAEYAPVLSRAGMVVERLAVRATRGVRAPAAPTDAHGARSAPAEAPRFQWASEFLGALTVHLVKPPQSSGPAPDGIRFVYQIESGEVRGPKLNGQVRGGDWVLLRRDGVGVVETRISCETVDGALLLAHYTGIVDLGPDGYERALRGDLAPAPPVVLTPQFTTSHRDWLWLNRLQCLAVGQASMADLVVRFDIHAVRVG